MLDRAPIQIVVVVAVGKLEIGFGFPASIALLCSALPALPFCADY